jgi:hypothetical protein
MNMRKPPEVVVDSEGKETSICLMFYIDQPWYSCQTNNLTFSNKHSLYQIGEVTITDV